MHTTDTLQASSSAMATRTAGLQERLGELLDDFVSTLAGHDWWAETDLAQQAALLDDVESTLQSVLRRHVRGA